MGPLQGLTVIDLTSVLMGPYATQFLGDYGARVIKVEPAGGDIVRRLGPGRSEDMGHVFLNTNRSKESVVLNLKSAQGRRLLLRLCGDADVLVSNMRPAAMARLGLSFEELSEVNPRLIVASLTGYGQGGRYASRPAYDDLIQGGALLPFLLQRSGACAEPAYVPLAMADRVVGLTAVGAIVSAVVGRERSGRGQHIEIPMFETMVSFVLGDHLGGQTFVPAVDEGGGARLLARGRKPYRTRDGYLCVLLYNDHHWRAFTAELGVPDLMDDPRFATYAARLENIDAVCGWLEGVLCERTSDEWTEVLDRLDIPVMRMHDFNSILEDPHLTDVGFFETVEHPTEGAIRSVANPVRFSGTPVEVLRQAPAAGADTREVLKSLGVSVEELDELGAAGAIAFPSPVTSHASDAERGSVNGPEFI